MKEIDGLVKIKKYTDDAGTPICGGCLMLLDNGHRYECNFEGFGIYPGPSCPIWYGDSKSSISALIEEIANNKEVIVSANPTPQIDADEPRYAVHITGPERLLIKLADLFFIPPQEK